MVRGEDTSHSGEDASHSSRYYNRLRLDCYVKTYEVTGKITLTKCLRKKPHRFSRGVSITGPKSPEGKGFQPEASKIPFFAFSLLRAGMLVL